MRAVHGGRCSACSESGPAVRPQFWLRRHAHDNSEGTPMKTETIIAITTLVTLTAADPALAHPGSGIAVDREGQVYFTQTNGHVAPGLGGCNCSGFALGCGDSRR